MKKRLICGAIGTFFLTAASAQTVVLSEDFEAGMPAGWTIVIQDTFDVHPDIAIPEPGYIDGWTIADNPNDTTDEVAAAASWFDPAGRADRWLITPSFAVEGYGNFLSWEAKSHDPSFQDGYYVLVSTTDNQIASFTDTIAAIGFEESEWISREVNLSEKGYADQTIYIAFVLRSIDAFKLYIDDIEARVEDPLGINEPAETEIALYPNPATDHIAVQAENVKTIRIVGLNGQQLLQQDVISGEQIDVSGLAQGTYIAEVETAKGIARSRFVKR